MTRTYVYNVGGELVAEYTNSTASSTLNCAVCYPAGDSLGSTRLITAGSTGQVVKRMDFLPFGEIIPAGVDGRTTAQGYESTEDPTAPTMRFTGKERDSETYLDYFGARYFSGAQGRFTSPDPFNVIDLTESKETVDKFQNYISNPQRWNHYSYVLNNSLRYTDPLGLLEYDATLLGKKIHIHIDDHLSDQIQNTLKTKLDLAIANINSKEAKLTEAQVGVLANLKSIEVEGRTLRRPYSQLPEGKFFLTSDYINSASKAFLSSAIGHDAYHMLQYKIAGPANSSGVEAERDAFVFQLGSGQKVGISAAEAGYLRALINDPAQLRRYYDSPVRW